MKYYSFTGTDNGSEFYYMNDNILKHCPECGLIINREEAIELSIETFKIKKKKYILSHCYDGPTIVSERFVDICNENKLNGMTFIKLPKSHGFYLFNSINILHYDYDYNANIYLKNKCTCCNQWYEVSEICPIKIIDMDEKLMNENTFYKADIEVGEKVGRWPLLLATENIPFIFKKMGIKDIFFRAAGKDWIYGDDKRNIYK
jgi:hypothetical protein